MTPLAPIGSLKSHVWLPLLAFVAVAVLLEATRLDLWLADLVYQWEGGAWSLRRDAFVRDVLHDDANRVISVVYALLLVGCAAAFFIDRLARYRWGLLYLVTAIAGSTLLVALLKDVTRVNCPWSVDRYGGDVSLPADMAGNSQPWAERQVFSVGSRRVRLCVGGGLFFLPPSCPEPALVCVWNRHGCWDDVRHRTTTARCALCFARRLGVGDLLVRGRCRNADPA